jgi:hypothetical protein
VRTSAHHRSSAVKHHMTAQHPIRRTCFAGLSFGPPNRGSRQSFSLSVDRAYEFALKSCKAVAFHVSYRSPRAPLGIPLRPLILRVFECSGSRLTACPRLSPEPRASARPSLRLIGRSGPADRPSLGVVHYTIVRWGTLYYTRSRVATHSPEHSPEHRITADSQVDFRWPLQPCARRAASAREHASVGGEEERTTGAAAAG